MQLTDLYQEIILDHGKSPRNHRELPGATHNAQGYNPLCGDQITVWLKIDEGIIEDISFSGQGCAISQASASMMTQALKGKSIKEATELFEKFRSVVMSGQVQDQCDHGSNPNWEDLDVDEELGILSSLTGVRKYPNRIKCATLAWHAMHSALEPKND